MLLSVPEKQATYTPARRGSSAETDRKTDAVRHGWRSATREGPHRFWWGSVLDADNNFRASAKASAGSIAQSAVGFDRESVEIRLLQYSEDKGKAPEKFGASNENVNDFLSYYCACQDDSPAALKSSSEASSSGHESGSNESQEGSAASDAQEAATLSESAGEASAGQTAQVCMGAISSYNGIYQPDIAGIEHQH